MLLILIYRYERIEATFFYSNSQSDYFIIKQNQPAQCRITDNDKSLLLVQLKSPSKSLFREELLWKYYKITIHERFLIGTVQRVDAVMQIPYFSMPADLIKSQGQIQYALFILL